MLDEGKAASILRVTLRRPPWLRWSNRWTLGIKQVLQRDRGRRGQHTQRCGSSVLTFWFSQSWVLQRIGAAGYREDQKGRLNWIDLIVDGVYTKWEADLRIAMSLRPAPHVDEDQMSEEAATLAGRFGRPCRWSRASEGGVRPPCSGRMRMTQPQVRCRAQRAQRNSDMEQPFLVRRPGNFRSTAVARAKVREGLDQVDAMGCRRRVEADMETLAESHA